MRVGVVTFPGSLDDVDAQHHAGAAAVGLVVHLARAQGREVAVAPEAQLELALDRAGEHQRVVAVGDLEAFDAETLSHFPEEDPVPLP